MSTRIAILGPGHDIGRNNNISIDRTFPGILHCKLSESEWNAFCINVDKVLKPVQDIENEWKGGLRYFICRACIYYFIFICIILSADLYSSFVQMSTLYLIFAIFAICIVEPIKYCSMRANSKRLFNSLENLKQLCDIENMKRPDVSFHLRAETDYLQKEPGPKRPNFAKHYIECSVGGMPIPSAVIEQGLAGENSPLLASLPYTTPVLSVPISNAHPVFGSTVDKLESHIPKTTVHGGGRSSAVERLLELKSIKGLISEEQYNTKQQEILNSI